MTQFPAINNQQNAVFRIHSPRLFTVSRGWIYDFLSYGWRDLMVQDNTTSIMKWDTFELLSFVSKFIVVEFLHLCHVVVVCVSPFAHLFHRIPFMCCDKQRQGMQSDVFKRSLNSQSRPAMLAGWVRRSSISVMLTLIRAFNENKSTNDFYFMRSLDTW